MLFKRTNVKLEETKKYLHCWRHGKKATKSWLLDSEEKCLIQTASKRTAYSTTKNPKKHYSENPDFIWKKAKYMQSEVD